MQVDLVVVEGKQQGAVIPIRSKFLVGREEDCQLRPNSELVSRHHCVFTIDDYSVRLRDLGSTNGTYVNEERTNGLVVLKSGDRVRIGKLVFEVRIQTAAPAPQPAAQPAPPPRPAPQPMAAQPMPVPQPMYPQMPGQMPMQGYPMAPPPGYPLHPQYPGYPYPEPSTQETSVDWPVPQYLDPSQSGTGIYAGDTALIQGANKAKKPPAPVMPVRLPDPSTTGAPEPAPAPPPAAEAAGTPPAAGSPDSSRSSAADIIRQYMQRKPR